MNPRPQAASVIHERGATGRRRGREDTERNYLESSVWTQSQTEIPASFSTATWFSVWVLRRGDIAMVGRGGILTVQPTTCSGTSIHASNKCFLAYVARC